MGLVSFFLSYRQLQVVLDGKSSQEYLVNVEFLKAPFLVLHFSYFPSMTFLIMLSLMLLCMLMILLSILIVIRHLIWGNNLNWLLNLNLIYETLCTGARSGLLISILGKLNWFCMIGLITLVPIDVKMDVSVLEENSSFKILGLTFSSKLDWDCYIISIAKTSSKKISAFIHSVKFLSPELALYICKPTIQISMEYCCYVWAGAPSSYLELQDCWSFTCCFSRTLGSSSNCGHLKSFL